MHLLLLTLISAFFIAYFTIPIIINGARTKNILDTPNERSSHTQKIPNLGGISILIAFLLSQFLWLSMEFFIHLQHFFCAIFIITLIGIKDDIKPISPIQKLIGQIIATCFIIIFADVRLTSLFGIFDLYELPIYWSYAITFFTFLAIINGFNLIDGIDGLASSIAIFVLLVLGSWFTFYELYALAFIDLGLLGAIVAFLKYNITPAKIFLGDSGSLLIGLILAFLTVQFIESHHQLTELGYTSKAAPILAFGLLILPIFDTLRVFFIRLFNGTSPLKPDRKHLHHLFIDANYSHKQTTSILLGFNILLFVISIGLSQLNVLGAFTLLLVFCYIFVLVIKTSILKKKELPNTKMKSFQSQTIWNDKY